jgi:hypothetical protein
MIRWSRFWFFRPKFRQTGALLNTFARGFTPRYIYIAPRELQRPFLHRTQVLGLKFVMILHKQLRGKASLQVKDWCQIYGLL